MCYFKFYVLFLFTAFQQQSSILQSTLISLPPYCKINILESYISPIFFFIDVLIHFLDLPYNVNDITNNLNNILVIVLQPRWLSHCWKMRFSITIQTIVKYITYKDNSLQNRPHIHNSNFTNYLITTPILQFWGGGSGDRLWQRQRWGVWVDGMTIMRDWTSVTNQQ